MRSRLRKGEIAEALFVAKALSLGMNVSKPFGQNCRYDFMVETMGRAVRVQVKSTWQKKNVSRFAFHVSRKRVASRWSLVASEDGRQPPAVRQSQSPSPQRTQRYAKEDTKEAGQYVIRAGGTTTRGARRYRASEVDYIVAYVGPEDEWYVIPVARIPSAFTIVLPGKYERYKEAWDQLCPRGVVVGDIKACADPACSAAPENQFPETLR